MNREPVMTALVVTVVTAILACLVAFNIDVTQAQQDAIIGLVTAIGALLSSLWARSRVTPVRPPT